MSARRQRVALAGVLAVVFGLIFVLPPTVAAQQTPSISGVSLTPETATVGDRVVLAIDIDHDAAFTVEGPAFAESFGDFEVIEIAEPTRSEVDDVTRTSLRYELTTFTIGTARLPALTLRWRGAAGAGELTTPEQRVAVRSVLLPGETELRPLKPQLEIATEAPSPLWPATIVAMFALLTAAGYLLMARAIGAKRSEPVVVARVPSADERARARLDALAAEPIDDIKAYYASIATTLRAYLSERFGFPAYAMTRRELQRHMSREGVERWPARLTANLLEQCDAVQFAGFRPARERSAADLTAAYEIVELTSQPPSETAPGVFPEGGATEGR